MDLGTAIIIAAAVIVLGPLAIRISVIFGAAIIASIVLAFAYIGSGISKIFQILNPRNLIRRKK